MGVSQSSIPSIIGRSIDLIGTNTGGEAWIKLKQAIIDYEIGIDVQWTGTNGCVIVWCSGYSTECSENNGNDYEIGRKYLSDFTVLRIKWPASKKIDMLQSGAYSVVTLNPSVNSDFKQAYNLTEKTATWVTENLISRINKQPGINNRITFQGHSLGGKITAMYSAEVASLFIKKNWKVHVAQQAPCMLTTDFFSQLNSGKYNGCVVSIASSTKDKILTKGFPILRDTINMGLLNASLYAPLTNYHITSKNLRADGMSQALGIVSKYSDLVTKQEDKNVGIIFTEHDHTDYYNETMVLKLSDIDWNKTV